VIDLERFVRRGDINPVYFDTRYYLYPDGPIAVEALRVIEVAMVVQAPFDRANSLLCLR